LGAGYDVHFDLYTESVRNLKTKLGIVQDTDVAEFAPFSHDAVTGPHEIIKEQPLPDGASTVTLLGAALIVLGGFNRRLRK
jgi:hypothetical protein